MSNIILIGFMGSGKTTFGKWLSNSYGYEFLDTDEYIEQKEKRIIKDIFAQDGEEVFRDMETATVKELIGKLDNTVISVGGGLPVRDINRKLLKELGFVVYLETSRDELLRRLSSDTSRPLLAGGNLSERIDSLMSARKDLYEDAADFVLKTDGLEFENMYNAIKARMEEKR